MSPPPEPAGLRPATPEDAEPIEALRVATWKVAYRGLLPDAFLDALAPASGEAMEARRERLRHPAPGAGCLVTADPGGLVGFVNFGPTRDPDVVGAGEVYALYVDVAHWGTGRGRTLMTAAVAHLAEAGFDLVTLWVLRDNARSLRFYRAAGFAADGAVKAVLKQDVTLEEVRLRRMAPASCDRAT